MADQNTNAVSQPKVSVAKTMQNGANSSSHASPHNVNIATKTENQIKSWIARTSQFYFFENELKASHQGSRRWRTTLIRFGPLSGILTMFLAMASITASLGILAGSDGRATADWPASPATYLAIFTALANLSVRYAAVQGVIIAWWLRALNGATLSKLHWDWRSGTTLRGAVAAGRHMGLLGLACVFSTVVVLDGPLLQRSSTVRSEPIRDQFRNLDVSMVPEIPRGFNGLWVTSKEIGDPEATQSNAFNKTTPSNNGPIPNTIFTEIGGYDEAFSPIATSHWINGAPLRGAVRGCNSTCKVKLQAPALFSTSCTSHLVPLRLKEDLPVKLVLAQTYAVPLDHDVFLINVNLIVNEEREKINLITGYADIDNCEGVFNYTVCTLEPGIGLYDLTVNSDDEISLLHLAPPSFVAMANNTAVNHTYDPTLEGHPSTLATIVNGMYDIWETVDSFFGDPKLGVEGVEAGAPKSVGYTLHSGPHQKCSSYRDPREDVLQSINQFMVYTGAAFAGIDEARLRPFLDPGLQIHYTISAAIEGEHNVYHTDYWFFLGAAVLEIVCIALIAPTYWGWWKIGRSVSFSPLELAKAFESPMFSDYYSNSTGSDLARSTEDSKVKYGALTTGPAGEKTKIAFGEASAVTLPRKDMHFDL